MKGNKSGSQDLQLTKQEESQNVSKFKSKLKQTLAFKDLMHMIKNAKYDNDPSSLLTPM